MESGAESEKRETRSESMEAFEALREMEMLPLYDDVFIFAAEENFLQLDREEEQNERATTR